MDGHVLLLSDKQIYHSATPDSMILNDMRSQSISAMAPMGMTVIGVR